MANMYQTMAKYAAAGAAALSMYTSPALAQGNLEGRVALGIFVQAPSAMIRSDPSKLPSSGITEADKLKTQEINTTYNIGMTSYKTIDGKAVPIVNSVPYSSISSLLTEEQRNDLSAKAYRGDFEMNPNREQWTTITKDQGIAILKAMGHLDGNGQGVQGKVLHPVRGKSAGELTNGNVADHEAQSFHLKMYRGNQ